VTASDDLAALMAPGPVPGSEQPCGCHICRPEGTDPYLTVLCDRHENALGDYLRSVGTPTGTPVATTGETAHDDC